MRLLLRHKSIYAILSLLSLAVLTACGSAQELASGWSGEPVKIDGNHQDWQGSLTANASEGYSTGFKNDGKFLYLCFVTSDRGKIMNIMRSGLSVVFDSPSNPEKNYTIRFPLINPADIRETVSVLGPDAMQKEGVGFLFQEMLDKQIQFIILQEDFLNTVSIKNKENIEVKMGTTNELLIFEGKVPLMSTDSSFPIGANAGDKIAITFETDPARVAFREGQSAGQNAPRAQQGGGGGRGGRGGQQAQQPSGDAGGGPVNITQKFSAKFQLSLSKEGK